MMAGGGSGLEASDTATAEPAPMIRAVVIGSKNMASPNPKTPMIKIEVNMAFPYRAD